MGHSVEYVLDIPGPRFVEAAPGGVLSQKGDWEDTIPGSKGTLIGRTDGLITCLTYAEIKYSWLVAKHEESLDLIKAMDAALTSLLPQCRILRVDELLLDCWELRCGENCLMATDAFDNLLSWLHFQDCLYWQLIS